MKYVEITVKHVEIMGKHGELRGTVNNTISKTQPNTWQNANKHVQANPSKG